MSHNNSYPSPSAAQVGEGAGPFYAAQQAQRVPPHEELELSAQLSREIGPGNNQGVNDGQGMQQHVDQKFSQPIYPPHPMQSYPQMNATPQGAAGRGFLPDPSNGDDSSARKKSKVSRACDECRRKKIRCDAESDAPGHPKCSNCMRTQQTCQFSRQPMKRGPSKGYIKELADRLDQVEKKVTGGGPAPFAAMSPGQSSGHNVNEYGLGPESAYGRKRTHSMSENLPAQAYVQSQMQRTHEDYQTNDSWQARDGTNEPPSAYSESKPTAPYADMTYNNSGNEYSASTNGALQAPTAITTYIPGPDYHLESEHKMPVFLAGREQLMGQYYRMMHPSMPVLANQPSSMRTMLIQCSQTIRDAFFGALLMIAMRSSASFAPIDNDDEDHAAAKEALRVIASPEQTHLGTRTVVETLVFLQVCVLTMIGIDMSGPASSLPLDLPARGIWFGLGLAAAQQLRLFRFPTITDPNPEPDSEYALSRRALWGLIIADCYHAISTGNPTQFKASSTGGRRGDPSVFGTPFYNFVKHTRILSYMAGTSTAAPSTSNVVLGETLQSLINNAILDTEVDMNATIDTMPFLDAAFQHNTVLVTRYNCNSIHPQPSDVLDAAHALTKALLHPEYPLNPLTHHFVAVAAQTFVDLTEVPTTKVHAITGLKNLRQAIEDKHILGSVNGSRQWESVLLEVVKSGLRAAGEPMDRASLQHLADAAVGGSEGGGEAGSGVGEVTGGATGRRIGWSDMPRNGYVSSFH